MSKLVRSYYNSAPESEWERLEVGLSRIEFASTLQLIEKYFPTTGCVCDIGSGPGRYALELAKRGYQVTLFDLSENLLSRGKQAFVSEGISATNFIQGDARDLSVFEDESFDAALHLGPLYHLINREDRSQALGELVRVLKPGCRAIVAYLNAWGLLRAGVVDFPQRFSDAGFLRSMLEEKTFAGGELSGFTECHWSNPEIARKEIQSAGLQIVSYAGVESFVGGMAPLLEMLKKNEPSAYANVVTFAAETAELPQFRDATDHVHFVVEK
ncbi:MAG: methyltransferase domain-containing protein [Candidatus Latescibacteria bacterium]|nr:methyltransferase domain-containing protein [Candidatus Latescibacterota bacterium]